MSADSGRCAHFRSLLLAGALLGLSGNGAQADDTLPDAEFLEYLGSWEGSDEEWLLVQSDALRETATDDDERNDPAPDGEESTESTDDQ
ncbi:MAG: hypothetical protein WDZ50_07500 [Woeseia sp.]